MVDARHGIEVAIDVSNPNPNSLEDTRQTQNRGAIGQTRSRETLDYILTKPKCSIVCFRAATLHVFAMKMLGLSEDDGSIVDH